MKRFKYFLPICFVLIVTGFTQDPPSLFESIIEQPFIADYSIGRFQRGKIVHREKIEFEFCEDPGVAYEAFRVNKSLRYSYEDIDIVFSPMTEAQYQNLKVRFGTNLSRVKYIPGKIYHLIDFLPPTYQAIHGVEEEGTSSLYSNCWSNALELLLKREDSYVSVPIDMHDKDYTKDGTNVLANILRVGKVLSQPDSVVNPDDLNFGDLQFGLSLAKENTIFEEEIPKELSNLQISHIRNFVSCGKNGNHLMFEMPRLGAVPRRFVLSKTPFIPYDHDEWPLDYWVHLEGKPTFVEAMIPKDHRDLFEYPIVFDSEGYAHLVEKLTTVSQYRISPVHQYHAGKGDVPEELKALLTILNLALPPAKRLEIWDFVKQDYLTRKQAGTLNQDYVDEIPNLLSLMWEFDSVLNDPIFKEMNALTK